MKPDGTQEEFWGIHGLRLRPAQLQTGLIGPGDRGACFLVILMVPLGNYHIGDSARRDLLIGASNS